MKTLKITIGILAILAAAFGVYSLLRPAATPLKGIQSNSTAFITAVDASSTCGQLSAGTLAIGASAGATSTGTGVFSVIVTGGAHIPVSDLRARTMGLLSAIRNTRK